MSVRDRHQFASSFAAVALLAALSALSPGLTGCSHRSYQDTPPAADQSIAGSVLGARPWQLPTSAGIPTGRLLYPLAVGNRWDYNLHQSITLVTADGPQPPQVTDLALRDDITGTIEIGARTYFLQQETNPLVVVAPRILPGNIVSLREDRSGLYQREVITVLDRSAAETAAVHAAVDGRIARPAERAAFERAVERVLDQLASVRWNASQRIGPGAGGPDPGELSLLRFPLSAGARWAVRESPRYGRVVLGRERVVVPAGAFVAWHLRGTSELFGPDDRVFYWYSSAGLVRTSFHFESLATDDAGNVIGRVIGDQDEVLTGLTLVDPNAPHALLESPVEGAEPQ
jgi:hypothetical protein